MVFPYTFLSGLHLLKKLHLSVFSYLYEVFQVQSEKWQLQYLLNVEPELQWQ